MKIVFEAPQRKHSRLFHAFIGACVGGAIAAAAWLISGELAWFFTIPTIALLAALAPRNRPRVIRGK